MTRRNPDPDRELVQRAYAAQPEPNDFNDFDVRKGLREVLDRARQTDEPTAGPSREEQLDPAALRIPSNHPVPDSLGAIAAALLGLLHEGTQTGGQLVAAARDRFGSFLTITRNQLYRELPALADAGLVRLSKQGPRSSQQYLVTAAGKEAFKAWLASEPSYNDVHSQLIHRLMHAKTQASRQPPVLIESAKQTHSDRHGAYADAQVRATAETLTNERSSDSQPVRARPHRGMEIGLLGPLTVLLDGVAVQPSATKPRKVLATLAMYADQHVPTARLFEELWGGDIPRSANTTVQTYILHLRNLIGAALDQSDTDGRSDAKRVLVTYPGGYLLDTMGGRVDVREFDRLAALGHQAREMGDFEGASRHFNDALGIWRGRTLVDVHTGPLLEVESHRLEQARLDVLDRRIDADLRLGRHHELLGELVELVGRYRTHEGLHAHLMLALYRSGRPGEAIDVYRRLRTGLVNELGLEPSPSLRRLEHAILMSDRRLAKVEAETAAALDVRATRPG